MRLRSLIPILPAALLASLLGITASLALAAPAQKAKCLVSGKEIEVTEKTKRVYVQGKPHYFCCDACPKTFAQKPEKYLQAVGNCPVLDTAVSTADAESRLVVNNGLWYVCCAGCKDTVSPGSGPLRELVDVVSGKKFKPTSGSPRAEYRGQIYVFESEETRASFDREPAKHAVLFGR